MLYESIEHADDAVVRFVLFALGCSLWVVHFGLFALEINFVLKIESNAEGISCILHYKANRKALTALCSVVKHLGSGQSTQEVRRNTRLRLVFLPTILSCSSRFLRALQPNRAQLRLLYLLNR